MSSKAIDINHWLPDPLITKKILTEADEDHFLETKPIIVSLGDSCQPANNLLLSDLRFMAYPFDWIIAPFKEMCDLIETDFRYFKQRDFFTQTYYPETNHTHFSNTYYPNLQFPHIQWDHFFDDLTRRINRFNKMIQYCISTKKICHL